MRLPDEGAFFVGDILEDMPTQLSARIPVLSIMKKSLRKNKTERSLAEITEMLRESQQQFAALNELEERQAGRYSSEGRPKRTGLLGAVGNYFRATPSDLRQSINQFLFTVLGVALWNYYSQHVNGVLMAAVMSVLVGIPLIVFWRMGMTFWRDRRRAYKAGGRLAVHDLQFGYGLAVTLAGAMMFVFNFHHGPQGILNAEGACFLLSAGGLATAYNYRCGRRLATEQGREFPALLAALRSAGGSLLS